MEAFAVEADLIQSRQVLHHEYDVIGRVWMEADVYQGAYSEGKQAQLKTNALVGKWRHRIIGRGPVRC